MTLPSGSAKSLALPLSLPSSPCTDPGPLAAPSPTELFRCEPWSVMASVCPLAQVNRKLPDDNS